MPEPINPLSLYERDGFDKMLKLAKTLCRLVTTFEAIIRAKYPDNVAIIALLDAIKVLCGLLPAADAQFTAISLVETTPPATIEDTPGYDPSAPPAADPELT